MMYYNKYNQFLFIYVFILAFTYINRNDLTDQLGYIDTPVLFITFK